MIIRYLCYKNTLLPGDFNRQWRQFLKNAHVEFYTSRNDRMWFCIRGKGFMIWISDFSPDFDENGDRAWLTQVEILRSAPVTGMEAFNEFLSEAVSAFSLGLMDENKRVVQME
jgi:hypothetical protein